MTDLLPEVVFDYPGLGRELVDSVSFRDLPMIQAIALLWAVMYVFFSLGADLMTAILDPRLRCLRGQPLAGCIEPRAIYN